VSDLLAWLSRFFGSPIWLLGTFVSLAFGGFLLFGAYRAGLARRRFGEDARLAALMTYDASTRRAYKGTFLVLASALAFAAAARPHYGKEKQLIPATKVDVIVALDFSKSMYARDVEPSRSARAKAEVAELIQSMPGARFGAVAFAGDAMGFPVTEDGPAVAQFFRGLEPNDMPVGGTNLTRALELARELLRKDPKSKDHKRYVILITDGEDLEGSPRSVANSLGDDETTIHVVQIGGRTPERIPEIGPDGEMLGWRKTEDGKFMTTELTARGETQLENIAKATPQGRVVRAEGGRTGIEEITRDLQASMQSGEFTEHYVDVYADVYEYPLGLAILLLLLEAFVTDAPRQRFNKRQPPPKVDRRFRVGGGDLGSVAAPTVGVPIPRGPHV
jgi:Ca-activated chloride channel homolog